MKKKIKIENNDLFYLENNKLMIAAKNLKQLEFLPFNRKSNTRPSLIRSIEKYGIITPLIVLKTNVVIGSEKYYIADGQHRYAAIEFLKKDAPVFLIDKPFKNEADLVECVSMLNSEQLSWSTQDYINAYASLRLSDYVFLNNIKSGNDIWTVTALATVFTTTSASTGGRPLKRIKTGQFKITREIAGMETLNFAKELSKYHVMSSRMLVSLNSVMAIEEFDKENFKTQYIAHIKEIILMDLHTFDDVFKQWI